MRAALLLELGEPLEIEEVELLPPAPHDAIVRPGATAVCITVCGTPECGACYWCMRGQPAFCTEMTGGVPRHVARRANGELVFADGGIGTFAERLMLREVGLVAVSSEVPEEHLCTLGCGAMSGLAAVLNIAEVQAGASMAVVGCGHLGLWMIQGGRLSQVKALTEGRGADYVFEAAGPPEAIQQGFAMTRHAGTFVPTGWSTLSATVTFNAVEFAIGARRILGCQYGGATIRRDVPRFAGLMEAGLVDPAPIVDRRFALEEINDAFAAAEAREVLTGVVVSG